MSVSLSPKPGGTTVTACRFAETECRAIEYAATCGLEGAVAGSLTHACRAVRAAHLGEVLGGAAAWSPPIRPGGWVSPGLCHLSGPETRRPAGCDALREVNKGSSVDITLGERIGGLRLNGRADAVLRTFGEPPLRGPREPFWDHGGHRQTWSWPEQGLTVDIYSLYGKAPEKVRAVTVVAPSTLLTRAGIGVGSSREEVLARCGDMQDLSFSTAYDEQRQFIAGSLLGGLLFRFENDRVVEMFVGDATE